MYMFVLSSRKSFTDL